MDNKNIHQLLDRYFEGHSTIEEEKQLKRYFNQSVIEDDLVMYQPLFQTLVAEKLQVLPDAFESDLMQMIENQSKSTSKSLRIRHLASSWILRVAAVLVLAFGMLWIYQSNNVANTETATIDWSEYEPETPEEALKLYKQAMLKLGKALNDGANAAAQNVERIDEVGQFFD